ncbi:MAG: DUF4349 domain-containing protein [Acidimicrobiales bacterium]
MRSILKVGRRWSVAALALVALVVAGAIQASVGSRTDDAATTVARDAQATAMAGGAGVSKPLTSAGADVKSGIASQLPPDGGPTAVVPGSPRVVRTADLRVNVGKDGFVAAFDRVASVAAANGGFVSSSSTSTNDDARSGELTVRVPADRFDSVRQSLSGLGEVEQQAIRGEDVSGQLVDYDARLKSLQAQEEALRVLVGQAKAVGDVMQVQSSLFNVRQQIEQLKAQRANLEQATTLATIHLSLFEPGAGPAVRPVEDTRSLARSFEQAVDGMLAVVGGMIVVVGYLVPIAVLALLGWAGSRILRRRPVPQAPAI